MWCGGDWLGEPCAAGALVEQPAVLLVAQASDASEALSALWEAGKLAAPSASSAALTASSSRLAFVQAARQRAMEERREARRQVRPWSSTASAVASCVSSIGWPLSPVSRQLELDLLR